MQRVLLPFMPYTFSVFTSIRQLFTVMPDLAMDECRGIEINERAQLDDILNYYTVVQEQGQPIAVFYFQLLSVKPYHFNISSKRIQQISLNLALRIVKPTLLVVGNLFRHDRLFHLFLNKTIHKADKAKIYQATTDYMIAHTNASGIFLKDVERDIAEVVLTDASYTPMPDDISMELSIRTDWTSFSDYEAMLKHKYLQRSRKIRQSFTQVRIQEFHLDDVKRYAQEIHQLYLQVCQKQLVGMGILNEAFFIELKQTLGESYRIFGFFYHDQLVAFSSAISHGDIRDMNYIGFDYRLNQELNLYFNILFHCIEMAIATHGKTLILGRTAIEAKAILGCTPDYRFSFYKLRNVIVNWFFQMVSKYFREQQGDKWKERHPFKSGYYAS